ncbi:MAG: PAS domain-containing protein [Rubrivivax sp.]
MLPHPNSTLDRAAAGHPFAIGRLWQDSPDLMAVLGANGVFEHVNPAWQRMLGWSKAELTSAPFFEFLHPEDVASGHEAFEIALARREPSLQVENRYRRKDGGCTWVSWVAVLEGGRIHCIGRDISMQKAQAENLLARNSEREAAWAVSRDLLLTATPDGRLLAVNGAWSHHLGWIEDELVGTNFSTLTHPDDLTRTLAAFASIQDDPLVTPYEYRLRHRDGSWRWFAWTAALEGGVVYATGRATTADRERDEALRKSEESLRQSQKMEAVGQLTGGLAHDFNNLLAAISGSLERLRKRIATGDTADAMRYVDMAQGASRRAASLTHRLLAFSRQQTLDAKPLALGKLVAGMAELLQRAIGPAVELDVVTSADLWMVVADAGQVENALLNLCINAHDAMPDGGKITVEAVNRWIDERTAANEGFDAGAYVALCVSDNGSGMAPAVVARAFDPFYTTKPIGMGTGLGLSMVYGFARQSGGHARIYSEPGSGTMVCVYLPRRDGIDLSAARDPAGVSGTASAEAAATVLLVDDEEAVRTLLAEVLTELGHRVLEASDGSEALAQLQKPERIDLLITDVGLRGNINGRQVADAARGTRPDLQVLFITGYAESAVFSHGHVNKGMNVMTKPFHLDDLATRVQRLIHQAHNPDGDSGNPDTR